MSDQKSLVFNNFNKLMIRIYLARKISLKFDMCREKYQEVAMCRNLDGLFILITALQPSLCDLPTIKTVLAIFFVSMAYIFYACTHMKYL